MPIVNSGIAFLVGLLVSIQGADDTSRLGAAVRQFIESYGDQAGAEPRPPADPLEFRYAFSDLSGDRRDDAVVLLQNGWCGSAGCTMLVFEGTADGFAYVSRSTIVSEPVRVLDRGPGRWSTLIVYARRIGDVLMEFDRVGFPLNPSLEPLATEEQRAGTRDLNFSGY